MAEVAGRQILFSGCAHAKNGAPPRQATLALLKALGVDLLYEAPDTGCCGARADKRIGDQKRRETLTPLFEGAEQGLDVVCLSPACRRVVAAYAPTTPPTGLRHPIRVRDVPGMLDEVYGLRQLSASARRGLTGLRVAVHSSCHENHNAVVREGFLSSGAMTKGFSNLTAVLTGSIPLPKLLRDRGAVIHSARPVDTGAGVTLATIVEALGARGVGDVSGLGHCSEVPLPLSTGRRMIGRARPAPCLGLAAQAGADVLMTPCFLCYIGLNGQQRALARTHPGRGIPVLHLSQLVGLACEVSPQRLELGSTTVSARRVLSPFVV